MAIVSTDSDLFRDVLTGGDVLDAQRVRGVVRCATGSVANLATDSNTSKYRLGRVPADALVHPDTMFDVENWGFAQVVIGTETDTDALVDQTKATENLVTPFAFGDANHGKTWWEALGFASSPGGEIEIWAHAEADAAGAGSMPFALAWIDQA